MLVGRHPFDPQGIATDDEIEQAILKGPPHIQKSPYTSHLSDSAIDLLEKLMQTNPKKRMTALQMLQHPWVKGITANTDKIKDSDEKLRAFRRYKSQLEVKIFCDWIADASSNAGKKVSLMEQAFRSFDTTGKGYVTAGDISRSLTGKKDEGSDAHEVSSYFIKNVLISILIYVPIANNFLLLTFNITESRSIWLLPTPFRQL